jgi:Xaa-Pro aminopeptidase
VHEPPNLNPRNDTPLVEGNVVTVEPGVYLPGRFGMRLEDFGVITATGYEVFTQTSHEPVIL